MAILTTCTSTFVDLNEINIGDVAPSSPSNNELWFSTTDNVVYKWDGSLKQWIVVNDYTDDIRNAIEGIELTARNLLYDTASAIDIVTNSTEVKTVKLHELVNSLDYTKHIKGNKVTFAFEWEYVGSTPMGSFYIQTNGPQYTKLSKQIAVSNTNYYGTETLTVNLTSASTFNSTSIVCTHNNGTIRIMHCRLLFGDKDLGWTQAPEDLVSKFETIFERTAKGIYMQASGNGQTSLVNVDNQEVKIKSNNINIEGYTSINQHFKVLPSGDLEAVNAKFTGTVDAFNIEGATIKGSVITTGTNFSVDSAGLLTAKNGKFSGSISASDITGSTFTSTNNKFKVLADGTIEATNGNFTGNINTGSTITGSDIVGSTIRNASNSFTVSADGTITGASLKGGTIGIGNGTSYNAFTVDTNGNVNISKGSINIGSGAFSVNDKGALTATSANITGNINSGSTITGANIVGSTISTTSGKFSVNSDGVLTASEAIITGKITIGAGSTVGASYLTGVIDNARLNSTITTGATNGTAAQTTLNSKASGWDSAKSTVDSNSANWINAYNRVKQWAYGAVTGSTTIDGGLIQTNTILANKIAIGDFNNYCTTPTNYTMNNGNSAYKINGSTMQHAHVSSQLTQLEGGEKFRITGSLYGSSSNTIATTFNSTFNWRDASGTSLSQSSAVSVSVGVNSTVALNSEITVPTRPANATYGTFKIWIGDTTQTVYWYNPSIRLMQTGELIVDGSIKTGHISTTGLNADVIKAGTISADRIDANTIVSKVNGATTTVSGNKIRTGKISANSGGSYLDLDNGSMLLGATSGTNYLQWTGSALNIKASSLSIGGTTAATTTNVSNAKTEAIREAVGVKDTRSTNETPEWYMKNYPKRTVQELKYLSTLGLGGSTCGNLETKVQWEDASGGYPVQTFYGIGTEIYTRRGTSATTWSSWDRKVNANQSDVFNTLTNNGTNQGIYIQNEKVYLNASMIKTGTIEADRIDANTIISKVNGATTSISGNKIKTGKISATTGGSYLDLDNGSMLLGSTSGTSCLQWTGSALNIKADNLSIGGVSAATTSQVQQTASQLEAKFSESGGYNLLRNSTGVQNTNQWNTWNTTSFISYVDDNIKKQTSSKKAFRIGNSSTTEKYVASPRIKIQPNKTYTISGKYYVGGDCKGIDVYWLESNTIDAEGYSTDVTFNTGGILVTDSSYSNGVWKSFSKTITTSSSAKSAFIRLDNNGSKTTSENYAYFSDLTVVEGTLSREWSPHPGEVYDGIIALDRDGVVVEMIEGETSKGSSRVSYEGIATYDQYGNTKSWFSDDNAYIKELNVDIINNPYLIQCKPRATNWYVGQSATGDGTGRNTSNKSNSIQSIFEYIRNTAGCYIYRQDINITCDNGVNLNEDIYIGGWIGSGAITINFGASSSFTGTIRIEECTPFVTLVGGGSWDVNNGCRWYRNGNGGQGSALTVRNANVYCYGFRVHSMTTYGYPFLYAYYGATVSIYGMDFVKFWAICHLFMGASVYIDMCRGDIGILAEKMQSSNLVARSSLPIFNTGKDINNFWNSTATYDGSAGNNSLWYPKNVATPPPAPTQSWNWVEKTFYFKLSSTTEGSGSATSGWSDKWGQGKWGSYKPHRGHAVPTESISSWCNVGSNTRNISMTLTMTRLSTSHGVAGATPVPKIKQKDGTYWSSGTAFARGDTKSIALSSGIIAGLSDATLSELTMWAGSSNNDYSQYNNVSLKVTCEKWY